MFKRLVSVIIPYFNKREYIEETIQSVLSQSYENFEIILIYDDEIKEEIGRDKPRKILNALEKI